jgi:hypothetical protein
MNRRDALLLFAIPALGALASIAAARGQTATSPGENGPIWDWRDHQPERGPTERREEQAGAAPSARDAAEVDGLYRELTGDDPNGRLDPQPTRPARPTPR